MLSDHIISYHPVHCSGHPDRCADIAEWLVRNGLALDWPTYTIKLSVMLSKVQSVDQRTRLGMRCRLSPAADVPLHMYEAKASYRLNDTKIALVSYSFRQPGTSHRFFIPREVFTVAVRA